MKLRLLLLLLLTLWCWTEADATTPSTLDEAAIEQNDAARDKRYPFWNGKICNKQCEGSKEINCAGKCRATRSVYREWRLVYDACMKNDNCAEWIPGCMPKCRSEANAAHPDAFGKKIRNFYMEWRLVYDACIKDNNCAEWIPGCMPKCRSEANAAHPGAFDKKKRDATLDATRVKRDAAPFEWAHCERLCADFNFYPECYKDCEHLLSTVKNADQFCRKFCKHNTMLCRGSCEKSFDPHGTMWEHPSAELTKCRYLCEDDDACEQKHCTILPGYYDPFKPYAERAKCGPTRGKREATREKRPTEASTFFWRQCSRRCDRDCLTEAGNGFCRKNCWDDGIDYKGPKRDATRRQKRGVCEHKCADDNDADCIQKCKARLREAHDIDRRR